jgi:hypothetical protein
MRRSTERPLDPGRLALWLDEWALRREKVLDLLDVRAARRARSLAERCRRVARAGRDGQSEELRREWLALRLEIAGFLQASGQRPRSKGRAHEDLEDD